MSNDDLTLPPEKQCLYCSRKVRGDLWMAVHVEEAHSDLKPLFSGPIETS